MRIFFKSKQEEEGSSVVSLSRGHYSCEEWGTRRRLNDSPQSWYILFIVDTGVFSRVTLLFFIRGHTNNTSFCLFNLFKGGYHTGDIFT